ncbi:hypothetical protein QVD99_005230 [Batrachochytrium dendrobatidis]|nr:hypothetical protein O5D80_006585 [Batrachochytrium dendrobatidis]KAJ8327829.1 hypothetical protein O5D80_003229 [Batrachochytrium dendrobatidis]KAJ8328643.1 hypothetical protein O5D80_003115 [Batrachochytrium dendrobatidis]KAK5668172.1 hypothetical protein QVD99_005210 [Batrachochytrium dendrobatidis]KAK5668193.1 hypothetical protein QVD99_005230 [Batrachochytrium dendrobatidis]
MNNETLKHVLVTECDGLVGALCVSIDDLKTQCLNNIEPTRADLLQYCLSNDSMLDMTRCFGSDHSDLIRNGFKLLLKKCLTKIIDWTTWKTSKIWNLIHHSKGWNIDGVVRP